MKPCLTANSVGLPLAGPLAISECLQIKSAIWYTVLASQLTGGKEISKSTVNHLDSESVIDCLLQLQPLVTLIASTTRFPNENGGYVSNDSGALIANRTE